MTGSSQRARTGVEGLDDILNGGLTSHRLYLIEGEPGSGKTTLALQYLLEGVRLGEKVLYITLSESAEELQAVAESHGWTLEGITVKELAPSEESLRPEDMYTMFHPSEVELGETTRAVLSEVERIRPTRVAFDSLSELRLIAGNPLRYRRQILALKQFFVGRRCTVLVLDDKTSTDHDLQVQSIAPTGWFSSSSSIPITAPNVVGSRFRSSGAAHFEAATTISSFSGGGWWSSRAWSRGNTGLPWS